MLVWMCGTGIMFFVQFFLEDFSNAAVKFRLVAIFFQLPSEPYI